MAKMLNQEIKNSWDNKTAKWCIPRSCALCRPRPGQPNATRTSAKRFVLPRHGTCLRSRWICRRTTCDA